VSIVLLPGMDGTGTLFRPLLDTLPPDLNATVVEYPRDEVLGYDALLERIPIPSEPFIIVAESFSGPLAVRLAARELPQLRGLVLAATFVRSPRAIPRWAVAPLIFSVPPPDAALRWALLGDDASAGDVALLRAAIRSVQPNVLAHRLREIAKVDVSGELRGCRVPVLEISASRDRLIPRTLSSEFSHLEHVELDAPHLVLQRCATQAAQHIVEFARRHL
jgi:pimeloyl-ACP methyl ester carboxylesterase